MADEALISTKSPKPTNFLFIQLCNVGTVLSSVIGPSIDTSLQSVGYIGIGVSRVLVLDQVQHLKKIHEKNRQNVHRRAIVTSLGYRQYIGTVPVCVSGPISICDFNPTSWMKNLEDNVLLKDLVIAGTHQSASLYGGYYVRCQNYKIPQQLENGIRALDIRISRVRDHFYVYHGIFSQRACLYDIVQSIETFIRSHPSEVLFVDIRTSGCKQYPPFSEPNFYTAIKSILHPSLWIDAKDLPERWYTTVGQVRGKIILFHLYDKLSFLQDKFDCGDPIAKTEEVLQHCEIESQDKLKLNYCNATGAYGLSYVTPASMALGVNERISRYLKTKSKLSGQLFYMDFPSDELVQQIIQFNFADALPIQQA